MGYQDEDIFISSVIILMEIVSVYDISGRLIYSDIINDAVADYQKDFSWCIYCFFCQRKKYEFPPKQKISIQMNNAIKSWSTIIVCCVMLVYDFIGA